MNNRGITRASSRVLTQNASQNRQKQQFDVQLAKKEHTSPSEERTKRSLPRTNFTNSVIALLLAFTNSVVILAALDYGVRMAHLELIYIACIMSTAHATPSILGHLFSLIKESLSPKKAE